MYEEIMDRLGDVERRLDAMEEEFGALLRVLKYAEDLNLVRAAAASAIDAMREIENEKFGHAA